MTDQAKDTPKLADLVNAGAGQAEAVKITDFIFMAHDISNAYLVTTDDGDVLINTGFPLTAQRNKSLFAPHRTGPLRSIILTQSHPDHFGGVPVMREADTDIIAERRFADSCRYSSEMSPCFRPRNAKLWGATVDSSRMEIPVVEPDIVVDERYAFDVGGRRFEAISTSGGETLDSLCVWLPDDRIVFTGNLVGPIWLSMPFLNTLRGDKPRLVWRYLRSLETLRALNAEMVITGHGLPIIGADRIRADIDRMHGAVSYLDRAVIDGMNAGKDVYTLMRDIRLPEELKIGEFHGNVRWAVRAIYHEYSGWFLFDTTTALYDVPRSSIDGDLVALAGGADALAARARARLDAGEPLEAMHLLEVALGATPENPAALGVKKAVLEKLLADSGSVNLSETMWLRSEIAATDKALA